MDTQNVIIVSLSKFELQALIKEAVEGCLQNAGVNKPMTWFTRMEAAKYLKISLPTFDKVVKAKHIKMRCTGRKQLFSKEEIDKNF